MEAIPWVGPLGPIIGAIIGATIGALVTHRFVLKRKVLRISIGQTENLTSTLREHYKGISFKVDEHEVDNLNRTWIILKNEGNAPIRNISLDIVFPGEPKVLAATVPQFPGMAVKEVPLPENSQRANKSMFGVTFPFLNPRETLAMPILFDGAPENCSVYCRLEGVKVLLEGPVFVRNKAS